MKYYRIIFSPTGGTEKVANAITKNWKQIETIDLTLLDTDYAKISFEKDSLVLIAMPSFGGVAPSLTKWHQQNFDVLCTKLIQMIYKLLLIELIIELCLDNDLKALLANYSIRNAFVTGNLQVKCNFRTFILSDNKAIQHREEFIRIVII